MPDVSGHGKVAPPDGPPRTVEVRLHRKGNVHAPQKLPPHDVMFENGKAFHNALGKGAVEHGTAHHADPHTIVALRRGKDQVQWVADEPFAVVRIRRGHGQAIVSRESPTGEDNPFEWPLPRCSGASNRIASGAPTANAVPGRYKVTFAIGNELVDPDLEIFP